MGLKWFAWQYSPQMLWEHHFRPIKMDHSQLYRGETITIKKEINDMCWYQWVFDLESCPPSRYFGVGCVCNVSQYVFPIFSSSSWVWNGLPDPETINIHHKCYGNIISDPSRWTIPNYTEEKPSPSRKKSMICVDTNGYLIWKHFHLRGILGLDVYVMWPDMFSYVFLIFMGLTWFTTSWNHKYLPQILWEHHFRPIKMEPFPTIPRRNHHHQQRYQWYVLIPMGIWFGSISTFEVFWGWMCM